MKRILLGAATTALLFAGCAQNELLDGGIVTPNDGKIRFSGTTKLLTTKAAPGNPYNSTADLQGVSGAWGKFNIVGYSGTTAIVGGDATSVDHQTVTFNGTSWEYGNEPYWPNSAMDFFAYANWDNAPTIAATGITATDVTIGADKGADEANSYKQKDLLVAATLGATKEVRTLVTFKHALTQIVFKAGNINPGNIDVKIGGVEIVNVGSKGDMSFLKAGNAIKWAATAAAATTDAGTSVIPNGTADAAIAPTATRATYAVAGIDNTVAAGFTVPPIATTDANTYSKYPRIQTALEPNNNALILMPQNFKKWDANSGVTATASAQYGAYIKLTALITKKGLVPDADADKFVYAGSISNGTTFEYGTVYIPVESLEGSIGQWVPGKRINYVITFGDSNSGSGGGGYDENGDPILVPIRFRAVVEDWVETDVPLLTATFEASSSAITHKFIDAYTNQLLSDISAAPAPKVYNSEIKIKGTVSSLIKASGDPTTTNTTVVDFQKLLGGAGSKTFYNAKFRPGSTLVFNFSDVSDFNGKTIDVLIPTGWEGRSYSAREANGSFLSTNQKDPATNVAKAAGETLVIENGTDKAKYAVLTKIATTGYSYICHIPYIEDNLAAIEMNENPLASAVMFNNTVYVKGTFPLGFTNTAFSADMLSKFTTAHYNSTTPAKVTIDLSGVTQSATWSILTWVPAGWSAQIGGTGTVMYPGDPITVTDATTTKTMVFTKTNSGIAHSYVRASILIPMLNIAVNNDVFYWDNVDYNVPIDLATSNPFAVTWGNLTTAGDKVIIKLKYPINKDNVTITTAWTKTDDGTNVTELVYTKP